MDRPTLRNPKRGAFWCDGRDLELAHALGLNISQICREALRAAIGRAIQEAPGVSDRTVQEYVALLRQEQEEREARIRELAASFQEKEERKKQIDDAVHRVLGDNLDIAYRRLPEFDQHGDRIDWWDEVAAAVSTVAGMPVTVAEIQKIVRGGKRG